MQIDLIPSLAIVLINLAVMGYIYRLRDRSRSGFYLLVNALSLVIWAGGQALYRQTSDAFPQALSLPYLATLLVPANMLYFALTRPHPLTPFWGTPTALFLCFAPPLALAALENYTSPTVAPLFNYTIRIGSLTLSSATRASFLFSAVALTSTLGAFGARFYTSTGPERNLSKHMIAVISAPLLFSAMFWTSGSVSTPAPVPSPSLVMAIIAQLGLLVVLRQEEIENRRLLSRVVFYLTTVLVAFLIVSLLSQFYVFALGGVVLNRTAGWLFVGATLVLILALKLGRVDRSFDQVLFSRAAEYRRIVDDTRMELLDARERLRRAERLSVAGELAARIAHEIKNPLGPIKGYTQMMREKIERSHDFEHRDSFLAHLDVIAEEVESIDRRVRELMGVARPPRLMLEATEINRIVERCASLLRLEIAASGEPVSGKPLIVETELAEGLPTITADANRVEEAIFNIARNALEATRSNGGGSVTMRTERESGAGSQDGITVEVRDAGAGFGAMLESPLPAFKTDKEGGTGLGLTITRSFVEAHGGRLDIFDSRNGAVVRFWLPVEAKENPGALLPKGG